MKAHPYIYPLTNSVCISPWVLYSSERHSSIDSRRVIALHTMLGVAQGYPRRFFDIKKSRFDIILTVSRGKIERTKTPNMWEEGLNATEELLAIINSICVEDTIYFRFMKETCKYRTPYTTYSSGFDRSIFRQKLS